MIIIAFSIIHYKTHINYSQISFNPKIKITFQNNFFATLHVFLCDVQKVHKKRLYNCFLLSTKQNAAVEKNYLAHILKMQHFSMQIVRLTH